MDRYNNSRHPIYYDNLKTEERNMAVFLDWCKTNHFRYKLHPNDTAMNMKGSDITIARSGHKFEIDIKGCQSEYATVALSYERSEDGVNYFPTLGEHKNTDYFVFIDENGCIYSISMNDVLLYKDSFSKTIVPPEKGGHWNKVVIIPKELLRRWS
jgi:hypothetical protein